HNDAVTPTLAFGGGGDGIYSPGATGLNISLGGVREIVIDGNGFYSGVYTDGFKLNRGASTLTFATISPRAGDSNTGMGGTAGDSDVLSLIAGGIEGIRITEDTTILINANGWLAMKEMAADPAALADHAFLYAKDVGGTGNMFVADAAADATQISSHNFSMFTPDPNERFPWSFYAENKALGVKMNVDMAGAIRAIEALTGKSFIYYEDLPKSVDLEAAYREQWKREWIKTNTQTVEVAKVDAFEMKTVEERVLYAVEIDGKIIWQPNKIDEKIVGYELVEGEVKPKIEAIYETKMVEKLSLKDGVEFSSTDGKFYQKIVPADVVAEVATVEGFVFTPPVWMKDRLKVAVME
ncbi:MAG: hypothetical protein KKB31_07740, partial [Nanoarchaeota archaeon]|nr:hypothetical protein [Nanoarchaeota archaeon]